MSIETETFGKLYSQCKGKAYRAAYRITLNCQDAEDVLSQAAEYALENITKLNPEEPFDAWFIRIIKIEARKLCKMKQKEEKIKSILCLAGISENNSSDSRDEKIRIVKKIFHYLPERTCMVLTDAYVENMSFKEMAEKYHCSIRNLYYLIKMAKEKARETVKNKLRVEKNF